MRINSCSFTLPVNVDAGIKSESRRGAVLGAVSPLQPLNLTSEPRRRCPDSLTSPTKCHS